MKTFGLTFIGSTERALSHGRQYAKRGGDGSCKGHVAAEFVKKRV